MEVNGIKKTAVLLCLISILACASCSNVHSGMYDGLLPFYSKKAWEETKNVRPDKITQKIKDHKFTNSHVYNFYITKYKPEEIRPIKLAVQELNPHYSPSQVMDAVYEVLAYRYVIYKETDWHKINKNVEVAKSYQSMIKQAAKKYDVPTALLLAVITWENSGGTSKISYADCGGLGQMSQGAIAKAHEYSSSISRRLKREAENLKGEEKAKKLREAYLYDSDARHREIAAGLGVHDERLAPLCNIEDSAAFLKVLMNSFDQRADLTISAYHNGTLNNDDLLRELMKIEKIPHSESIEAIIKENNITYLSLWQNQKIRDMLNGYLTMDKEITTSLNSHNALGDESDIYPWKVFGGYAAFLDTPEGLNDKIKKCAQSQAALETSGLESFNDLNEVLAAVKKGKLVKLRHKSGGEKIDIYMTPELAGFIAMLRDKLAKKTGSEKVTIPSSGFLSAKYFEKLRKNSENLKGIAFYCHLKNFKFSNELYSIINHAWLNDKIYISKSQDTICVCLNPRFGLEFYEYAVKKKIVPKAENQVLKR